MTIDNIDNVILAEEWEDDLEKLFEPTPPELITSIERILSDFELPFTPFPRAAVEAALAKREEITPYLLEELDIALNVNEEFFSMTPSYAIYLLAAFREKQAFAKIINILNLPGNFSEEILGEDEINGYGLCNILASTFDGNLQLLYTLIENKNGYVYARGAALNSLIPLYLSRQIDYETLKNYLDYLINKGLEKDEHYLFGIVAGIISELVIYDLAQPMRDAFIANYVDEALICRDYFDKLMQDPPRDLSKQYHLIDDVVAEMSWWACFQVHDLLELEEELWEDDSDILDEPNETYYRDIPKIGRNAPCPCESGKKYKKCCGMNQ